jgi:hypothetical protein
MSDSTQTARQPTAIEILETSRPPRQSRVALGVTSSAEPSALSGCARRRCAPTREEVAAPCARPTVRQADPLRSPSCAPVPCEGTCGGISYGGPGTWLTAFGCNAGTPLTASRISTAVAELETQFHPHDEHARGPSGQDGASRGRPDVPVGLAARRLGLSRRQLEWLVLRYRARGAAGLVSASAADRATIS